MVHEQKFKELPSSKCPVRVGGTCWTCNHRAWVLFPLGILSLDFFYFHKVKTKMPQLAFSYSLWKLECKHETIDGHDSELGHCVLNIVLRTDRCDKGSLWIVRIIEGLGRESCVNITVLQDPGQILYNDSLQRVTGNTVVLVRCPRLHCCGEITSCFIWLTLTETTIAFVKMNT